MAEQLSPKDAAIGRGWLALRLNEPARAAEAFATAGRSVMAIVGLGLAQLRLGEGELALATLKRIRPEEHDELSTTYLAEAQLASGDPESAMETATVAIDELNSAHGRSWLVRADSHRALGDLDAAESDYYMALDEADEIGVRERAQSGLAAIGRPASDDYD